MGYGAIYGKLVIVVFVWKAIHSFHYHPFRVLGNVLAAGRWVQAAGAGCEEAYQCTDPM
jgi:hypothetical protein